MDKPSGGNPLEQFVLLSKTAKGAAAVELIKQALEAPGVYVFGELLDMPNIKELKNGPFANYYNLLHLFAYGSCSDLKANRDSFPALTPTQLNKLRHLTIVSLATKNKCLPYTLLLKDLEVSNLRELEDLIIEVVYADVIRGKLDQKHQQLEVDYAIGRDIKPENIGEIIAVLQDCHTNLQTMEPNADKDSASACVGMDAVSPCVGIDATSVGVEVDAVKDSRLSVLMHPSFATVTDPSLSDDIDNEVLHDEVKRSGSRDDASKLSPKIYQMVPQQQPLKEKKAATETEDSSGPSLPLNHPDPVLSVPLLRENLLPGPLMQEKSVDSGYQFITESPSSPLSVDGIHISGDAIRRQQHTKEQKQSAVYDVPVGLRSSALDFFNIVLPTVVTRLKELDTKSSIQPPSAASVGYAASDNAQECLKSSLESMLVSSRKFFDKENAKTNHSFCVAVQKEWDELTATWLRLSSENYAVNRSQMTTFDQYKSSFIDQVELVLGHPIFSVYVSALPKWEIGEALYPSKPMSLPVHLMSLLRVELQNLEKRIPKLRAWLVYVTDPVGVVATEADLMIEYRGNNILMKLADQCKDMLKENDNCFKKRGSIVSKLYSEPPSANRMKELRSFDLFMTSLWQTRVKEVLKTALDLMAFAGANKNLLEYHGR